MRNLNGLGFIMTNHPTNTNWAAGSLILTFTFLLFKFFFLLSVWNTVRFGHPDSICFILSLKLSMLDWWSCQCCFNRKDVNQVIYFSLSVCCQHLKNPWQMLTIFGGGNQLRPCCMMQHKKRLRDFKLS